jgi:RNA polymerase sigma-70 factor (ECF subfamily)
MNVAKPAAAQDYLLAQSARLRAYLRVLLGDAHAAEDVLQELFLRYLRGGPAAGTEDADRWLSRVARNLALKALRTSRRRRAREAARPPSAAGPDPADLAGRKEDAARVQRCLDRLETEVRELVYLKVVEGLSYREIAEQTGVPRSTAVLRVQEGLARLAELFHGA